jgi:hypothetical protein
MNKTALFIVASLATVATSLATFSSTRSEKTNLKEVKDDKYEPGQVWSYKTRSGEETSTLTILRVEAAPQSKRIVHIHVDGIKLRNCKGGNAPETVEHMPFAKEFIDASVAEVIRKIPVPPYKNGYDEWRQGWDAGRAGFYTITVSQAIDVMQYTFNRGIGCPN